MAEFSPEWVALREGHAAGAELRFIDLDYASQHHAEESADKQPRGLRIESLQTEHYFRRSAYLREVARRCGCRDHDELWDHLIEVRGAGRSVEQVVRDVATYSLAILPVSILLKRSSPRMARSPGKRSWQQRFARCSIGMTPGRFWLSPVGSTASSCRNSSPKYRRSRSVTRQRFVMPASRATRWPLDALSGYAAGMPQPGYYQAVWEALEKNETAPLEAVALRMLVDLGQAARARDLSASVSVADEIAALEQARRLAHLRNHAGPAREDVWDAVRGCLVKGELGADGEAVLALARKLFTGNATGEVPPGAGIPPLVDDFRRVAELRKLPVAFGSTYAASLEIYRKETHRKVSRFLHRLEFLQVPYGKRRAGPDFLRGFDLRRVIENWDCQWVPQTESRLIECAVYGASVEEAAAARLLEEATRLDDEAAEGASNGVALLIRACLMGLLSAAADLAGRLTDWVGRDASFVSVAKAFGQLMLLQQSGGPLQATKLEVLPELLRTAYIRACQLLSGAVQLPDEQAAPFVDGCLIMNSRLSVEGEASSLDTDLFGQSLATLHTHTTTPPLLRGAATGLLYTAGRMDVEEVMKAVQGALSPAVGDGARQVDFLSGLLKSARELAWREPKLLQAVEAMFTEWSEDEFLRRLPHLRLAWSDLTPRETDRVAAHVASHHGVEKRDLTLGSAFSEEDVMHALRVFARVEQTLKEDGLEAWLEVVS